MLRNLCFLSSALLLPACLTLVPAIPSSAAEENPDGAELESRIESSLEQLVDLLLELPVEQRQAVLRRLEERLADVPAAAPPTATLPPARIVPISPTHVPPAPEPPPQSQDVPRDAPPQLPEEPTTGATTPSSPRQDSAKVSLPTPDSKGETESHPKTVVDTDAGQTVGDEAAGAPAQPTLANLRCQLALPLDSDGDQRLTAFDRHWRHLYLWTDKDGDGRISEREVESPYERSIREISLGLRTFVRGKGKRKRTLDITVDERVIFDVDGDGYGGPIPRRDNGALVIDADGLRSANGPDLRSSSGQPLTGFQALQPGQRWLLSDGSELVPRCR